jgi:hypothetical protein
MAPRLPLFSSDDDKELLGCRIGVYQRQYVLLGGMYNAS